MQDNPLKILVIDDDPKAYVFSNVFEVANISQPYEKVAVGKNLEYVLEEDLQTNAYKIGQQLKDGLHHLAEEVPNIGDVRGKGLGAVEVAASRVVVVANDVGVRMEQLLGQLSDGTRSGSGDSQLFSINVVTGVRTLIGPVYVDLDQSTCYDVVVYRGHAFVKCEKALAIVDMTDPETPGTVRTRPLAGNLFSDNLQQLIVHDGHIFVADKGDYYEIADGLPQFPASDPELSTWLDA